MRPLALRGTGIAALVIATATTGAGSALAGSSSATTDVSSTSLHTTVGYLGNLPAPEFMEPLSPSTSGYPRAELSSGTPGHLRFTDDGVVHDLDVATKQVTPVLGSGYVQAFDDPRLSGALDESFYPETSRVDRRGITVAATGAATGRVMAASEQTLTAYGRTITAGQATTLYGGGQLTGEGVRAADARQVAGMGVATSDTGLLGLAELNDRNSKTPNRLRVVPSDDGTYFGQQMLAGHVYTVASAVDDYDGYFWLTMTSRGDIISKWTYNGVYGVHLTAVADGTVYGIPVLAGHTYTLYAHGAGQGAVDGDDNLYLSTGTDDVSILPAHDATRFGRTLTTGQLSTMTMSPFSLFTVNRAGALIFSSKAGDFAHRLWSVAPVDGTFFGRTVTAGQSFDLAKVGSKARPGDGGDPRRLQFRAAGSDLYGGDLVTTSASSVSFFHDRETSVFVPQTSGTYFGRVMTGGRAYYVAGNGLPAGVYDKGLADGQRANTRRAEIDAAVFDLEGNLVVQDTTSRKIYVIPRQTGRRYGRDMVAGNAYVLPGSPGATTAADSTGLAAPTFDLHNLSLAVDRSGNVLRGGYNSLAVTAVQDGTAYGIAMQAGHSYTLGTTGDGPSGDGGPIVQARHGQVTHIYADRGTGNVYITEKAHDFTTRGDYSVLRVLAARTGSLFGQQVTAGNIYKLAGGPIDRTPKDEGGPATQAFLDATAAVTMSHDGRLLVSSEGRIREISADGTIHTLAGQWRAGFSPDGTPTPQAYLMPLDIDVDQQDHLILSGQDGVRTFR